MPTHTTPAGNWTSEQIDNAVMRASFTRVIRGEVANPEPLASA
ncbi:MAG TPA: hypothetical protein VH702_19380 [Vicinamibacterales bacterium]